MNIELKRVNVENKEILKNLLEKYDYEFSQWDNKDVNKLGLYGYNYLDYYWTEEKRWAFFIVVDGNLAGFAMINDYPEANEKTDYSLAEFFVMYKYRHLGVGKSVAMKVFDMFHGKWQLKRHPKNITSVEFWNKVISEYTGGHYRLVESYPNASYDDGTLGDIFFFEN
ncbi:GNAT family N-acetyltransferase [Desnuesiella massiliensis]|uniref:GNAT family N-acetyltransferase n=1 Tax=Desnuesiella massiliensis TaxID=1650662 RepID=UPI0006E3A8B6|nr:GNAT family N-acetyltransferase [Desnuesiella massiliensis]